MLQAKARWTIGSVGEEAAVKLSETLQLPPLLARLLTVRGIIDTNHAADFLNGGTDQTHDPFLLDDMRPAVERIQRALQTGEYIRVYGDYDADGVSSTVLMVHLLQHLGATFDFYIPHRVTEGYGLNVQAIEAAKAQGVSLIITVDTGISAVEQIARAAELGIDVIVTDHHEPPETLPRAYALINPKKSGCPYPFKHLAGVGVALKVAEALLGRWPEELVEYAAIGTVADLMPLQGENRIIVKQGIERMRNTANPGIKALLGVSGVQAKDVNSTHIGFALAPRINASGRLLSADTAVRLLTAASDAEAEPLADALDTLNKERQRIVDDMTKEAVAMVEAQRASGDIPKAIVLAREDWNVGVIGIVASKIVDRYYRPTVILGIDKETGMAKGSARSIEGFDLYRALTHCHELMDHFGGHQMAAGMTLAKEQISELSHRLAALAEEWLTPDEFIPMLRADLECVFDDVNTENIRQLEQLGPFGNGNPSPRIVFRGLEIGDTRTMGKEQQHMKLALCGAQGEGTLTVDAVGFNKGSLLEWISSGARVDVLGELSINEWNGVRKPQIMLQDLQVPDIQLFDWRGAQKPERKVAELCVRLEKAPQFVAGHGKPAVVLFHAADTSALRDLRSRCTLWSIDIHGQLLSLTEEPVQTFQDARDIIIYAAPERLEQLAALAVHAASVQRYYAVFGGTEEDRQSAVLPDREKFKAVYGSVTAWQPEPGKANVPSFYQAVAKRTGIVPTLVRFIVEVFAELGLIESADGAYRVVRGAAKRELSSSLLYQSRMNRTEIEQTLLYSTARELLARLQAAVPNHKETMWEEIV